MYDLEQIKEMLENIVGNKISECPDKHQILHAANGYTFTRTEFIGNHLISIKRPGLDQFYWTIGVREDD